MTIIDPTVISTAIVSGAAGLVSLVIRDISLKHANAAHVADEVIANFPKVEADVATLQKVAGAHDSALGALTSVASDVDGVKKRIVALESKEPAAVQDVTKEIAAEVKKQLAAAFTPAVPTAGATAPAPTA